MLYLNTIAKHKMSQLFHVYQATWPTRRVLEVKYNIHALTTLGHLTAL